MNRIQLNSKENHVASLGFGYVVNKVIPFGIRDDLKKRGLYEDLIQEVYLIALEGKSLGSDKEIFRFLSKRLYRFLRNYGYRRDGKSYSCDVLNEIFEKEN